MSPIVMVLKGRWSLNWVTLTIGILLHDKQKKQSFILYPWLQRKPSSAAGRAVSGGGSDEADVTWSHADAHLLPEVDLPPPH